MKHASRIFRYQMNNLVRSRWLIAIAVLLAVLTEVLFRFGGDAGRTITSLLNIVVIIVPLISVVLGTIYFYNSREFNELLLAQPMDRTSIYAGTLGGFATALCLAFLAGTGAPFLWHNYALREHAVSILTLLGVGCAFIVIFSSLAFFAATRFEDRIKGLGATLLAWFTLAVLWDGLLLLFVHTFAKYPYEPVLMGLIFVNPLDLGRILILLQLDISALMGYTGAIFRKVFGSEFGMVLSAAAMVVYAAVPLAAGLRTFRRKDF